MTVDMSANGTRKLKGIAYYHCPNRTGCGKYCESNTLEDLIAKEFLKLQFSDDFIEMVIAKVRTKLLDGRDVYEGRRQGLTNKKTAFENKLKTLEDKLLTGVLDDADFSRLRSETKSQIEKVEEELTRLRSERDVDIDVVQEVLLLTKDIYRAYTQASFDLKRQYLMFFWDKFEVADGVILKSVSSPLFEQLLEAEKAYLKIPETEKALYKASSELGILLNTRLRG